MPQHHETRRLPYTPEQLYDLVADIESYPEFLPWCLAARVRSREETRLRADLVIGFKVFRERFTSEISLAPKQRIEVVHGEGPFKHLRNEWRFLPDGEHATTVEFFVDFEFRSKLLQRAITALFGEAVRRMVAAFEARARALYGAPS